MRHAMGQTSIGLVVASAAACSYDPPPLQPPPVPDAAVVAPRPLGEIDGVCEGQPGRPRVLVYSYENLWRHLSNWYARAAIFEMCTTRGFHVVSTNDPRAINATRLAEADVIVFAVTSGPGLDRQSQDDLEAWIRAGGGTVGFEAAVATEPGWPFFTEHLGAAFGGHPPVLQRATVRVEAAPHPITEGLPPSFELTDQWYVFQARPEAVPGLQVLLVLDEATAVPPMPPEFQLGYHAIGWAHERFGGRVFYTGIGDAPDSFADPTVLELIGRGIEWTARRL